MTFVSYAFVVFFLVILALRLLLRRVGGRAPYLTALLLGSLAFYAWHVPAYLFLLFLTSGVDFTAAPIDRRNAGRASPEQSRVASGYRAGGTTPHAIRAPPPPSGFGVSL